MGRRACRLRAVLRILFNLVRPGAVSGEPVPPSGSSRPGCWPGLASVRGPNRGGGWLLWRSRGSLDWNERAIEMYKTLGAEFRERWRRGLLSGSSLKRLAEEAK